MSTICLKTQLKESVNNENLEIFGKLSFKVITAGTITMSVLSPVTIKADKQFSIFNGPQNVLEYTGYLSRIIVLSDNTTFTVDKYIINTLRNDDGGQSPQSVDFGDIDQYRYIRDFSTSKGENNYSTISGTTKLSQCDTDIRKRDFGGLIDPTNYSFIIDKNLNDFPNMDRLLLYQNKADNDITPYANSSSLISFALSYSNVSLNISDPRVNFPQLRVFSVDHALNVVGDLKLLANRMWDNGNGRTSETLHVNGVHTDIKWDGTPVYDVINAYSGYIHFSSSEPTISATA